jgi:hypothetical protein
MLALWWFAVVVRVVAVSAVKRRLEADTDDYISQVGVSKQSLSSKSIWRNPGPRDLQSALNSVPDFVRLLQQHDHAGSLLPTLHRALSQPTIVNTDYSGMGGCEMALTMIQEALPTVPCGFKFWRACDIDPLPRTLMRSQSDPSSSFRS